ncbi:cellulose synthase-like protein G3 [Impatiens glandulifera]|uniref:cellulose synthase-like protein G3 n=1 Tax=Impatiens glandulifera TaxID=253017 RepID=UPI001FB09AF4|nr:cellulose synthase-like protein G3 [Impatiens glandulifera]
MELKFGKIAGAGAGVLHTVRRSRLTIFNRIFSIIYTAAVIALLRHHIISLINSPSFITFSLLIADLLFAFSWIATQAFRFRTVYRTSYPDRIGEVLKKEEFPAIDVFVCTADPYKEPPLGVANTALSMMAYDYPAPEKISVYISDDGGSHLTLFAFMEAAKFAKYWLPFCRRRRLMDTCPDVFFRSSYPPTIETEELKNMYEDMRLRIENALEKGEVDENYLANGEEREAMKKWSKGTFNRQDHPTVIQVILDNNKDKDKTGVPMPNLIYVAREKSKMSTHHFKAGALNALLRVSAAMTNAPIVLTQDCDMYSNDPQTLRRALCYFSDPNLKPTLAYVQFPQRFHGLNKNDMYANTFKRLYIVNPHGMDGLSGPAYVGSGCFFSRRALFGSPLSLVDPEIPQLRPDNIVDKPIGSQSILDLAHNVARCNYEDRTSWGSKMGFRYGSLVEDYFTGYKLHCEGWISVFCHPKRAAFLGDKPITVEDLLNQTKRWALGLCDVTFSKYNPTIYGTRNISILMGLAYSHFALWPTLCVPIMIYGFLPQLALLNNVSIFPEVSNSMFWVYVFLFVASYAQDCLDFILADGTFSRWLCDQRMYLMRGLTAYLFATIEYVTKSLGIATGGFNVTSKVLDSEQGKRYDQGIFEFGLHSPMILMLSIAAIVNLAAFIMGMVQISKGGANLERLLVQVFVAGFVSVNGWPIYEAMFLRSDKGKIPQKTTIIATMVAMTLFTIAAFFFAN